MSRTERRRLRWVCVRISETLRSGRSVRLLIGLLVVCWSLFSFPLLPLHSFVFLLELSFLGDAGREGFDACGVTLYTLSVAAVTQALLCGEGLGLSLIHI